jgi:hypothetical protein
LILSFKICYRCHFRGRATSLRTEDIPAAGSNVICGSIYQATGGINSNEFLYGKMIKTGVIQFGFAPVFYIPNQIQT